MELDWPDLLDVIHSYRVDDLLVTAIGPVNEQGQAPLFSRARVKHDSGSGQSAVPKSIDEEDRETWGTAPAQQAAMRSVMALAGPPAEARPAP